MEEKRKGIRSFSLKECFGETKANDSRQIELDIVRALGVIFMVACHVYINLRGDVTTPFGYIMDNIIGGPFAAPVFMFAMGMALVYSRHSDANSLLWRGLKLLILGYVLNFVRLCLPVLIAYGVSRDPAVFSVFLEQLLCVDIFQFAGLALLVIGLFKKLKLDWWYLLLLAVVLSLLGSFLKDKSSGILALDLFLSLFYKANPYSYFPLFHWLLIPVVGMKVGEWHIRLTDKKRFYLFVLMVIFPISCCFELGAYLTNTHLLSEAAYYFYFYLPSGIFLCGFALAWIALVGLIVGLCKKPRCGFLVWISKNTLPIYCIHWVLIGFLMTFSDLYWPYETLPVWQWALFFLAILGGSMLLCLAYQKAKVALIHKIKARPMP